MHVSFPLQRASISNNIMLFEMCVFIFYKFIVISSGYHRKKKIEKKKVLSTSLHLVKPLGVGSTRFGPALHVAL